MMPDLAVADWASVAACSSNPDQMFAGDARGWSGEAIAQAKMTCRRCTVRSNCLLDGLEQKHGIFGGLTVDERANPDLVGQILSGGPVPDVYSQPCAGCGFELFVQQGRSPGQVWRCKNCQKAAERARWQKTSAAKRKQVAA